jgi:hypothetical protein
MRYTRCCNFNFSNIRNITMHKTAFNCKILDRVQNEQPLCLFMYTKVDKKGLSFGYLRERKFQVWHQVMSAVYMEA